MLHRALLIVLAAAVVVPTSALGTTAFLAAPDPATASESQATPDPDDVATIDGIIQAYYEVVSGPAGQPRQWERDRTLHHPDAVVGVAAVDDDGNPFVDVMSLAEYHEGSGGLAEAGFWEHEVHRVTERYGNIANVWSTYESRSDPDGAVEARGINSIQLVYDGERWWIISWVYDSERPGNGIPDQYLPHETPGP